MFVNHSSVFSVVLIQYSPSKVEQLQEHTEQLVWNVLIPISHLPCTNKSNSWHTDSYIYKSECTIS